MKRRDRTLAFAAIGAWAAVAGLVACLMAPLPAQAAKDTIVIAIPGRLEERWARETRAGPKYPLP